MQGSSLDGWGAGSARLPDTTSDLKEKRQAQKKREGGGQMFLKV